MAVTGIPLSENKAARKAAAKLYRTAFPKEERLPWWLLRLNAARQGIDLTAWMEGDTFWGFTYSVTADDLHFLLFFAVEEHLRGKGCGSQILARIQEKYPNVVLNVEPLDPKAENYAQRQTRFAFYQKNGFHDTGYHVWEVGGMFRVLATQPLNVPQYKKLFKKLTLGAWDVRLEKAE